MTRKGLRMKDWIDLVRSLVRPFIIIWGFIVYGISVMTGVEIPQLLTWLVTAVIIEYFGERAMKRFKENGKEK
jgi:hypothetical protein